MDQRSIASLEKLFERYRIVFWYDDKENLREDFESLHLDNVTKVEICNNEFSLKYRMLREEPNTKFLAYQEGPRPDDEHNWLLDMLLYQGEFHTDQTAIILSELDLDSKFLSLIEKHLVFFENKQRVQGLKKLLTSHETLQEFPMKMIAVCSGIGHADFEYSVMALLDEASLEEDEKLRLIQRCGLAPNLWNELKRRYSYENVEPGVKDFAFELFSSSFAAELGEASTLSRSAGVFLKNWKDIKTYSASYERFADLCEKELDIVSQLSPINFTQVLDCDLFKILDKHIITGMLAEVKNRTANAEKVSLWIRKRKSTQWYEMFSSYYDALSDASSFYTVLQSLSFSLQSLSEGVRLYSTVWKDVDRLYRSYLTNVGKIPSNSLFTDLTKDIENHYNNTYLMPLSNRWHDMIEHTPKWEASPIQLQRNFFTHYIKPFVVKDNKICVIISDALRYEVADELVSRVNGESRFQAEIEPMLSMLPSYTQLGMAALLPNKELTITEKGIVQVDGLSSVGLSNREKILKLALDGNARCFDAETILSMKTEECRAHVRDNQVLYVYHNVIDQVGDNRDSEEKVFEACQTALDDLQKLVRKLASANANNIIVTSDHGFLYQNNVLDDSDFVGLPVSTEGAFMTDRRFLVGQKLPYNLSMLSFEASQISLIGEYEVQIPSGINRMRMKGSGSRYVHGGASLQEVVIPVVKVNKKRQDDISQVGVVVLKGSSNRITSGQLSVTFYQEEAVTDKVKALTVKAGIYTTEGKLISETKDLVFDIASDNARDREMKKRFLFANNPEAMKMQNVELRLEVPIENTSKWKLYSTYPYILQRQMATDF